MKVFETCFLLRIKSLINNNFGRYLHNIMLSAILTGWGSVIVLLELSWRWNKSTYNLTTKYNLLNIKKVKITKCIIKLLVCYRWNWLWICIHVTCNILLCNVHYYYLFLIDIICLWRSINLSRVMKVSRVNDVLKKKKLIY